MINFINDILQDESKMDLISTIIIIIMPFVFFVFWGGFLQDIQFKGLDYKTIGIFTFIYVYAVLTARIKFRRTGKLLAIKNNGILKNILDQIKAFKFHRSEHAVGFKFVKELNIKKKENANRILTENRIEVLDNRMLKLMAKGKDYSHIEDEITILEKNHLIDTKFTPFSFKKLVNTNVMFIQKKERQDGKSIEHNVESSGFKRATAVEFARGLVFGGAVIGFAWGLPADVTIAYVSLLVIGILSTAVLQTIFAVLDTNGKFLTAMTNKLELMTECREYIDTHTHEVKPSLTLEQFVNVNTIENENALEEENE